MAHDHFAKYHGDIRAAVGRGGTVAFVTAQPDGRPTAVYGFDPDRRELASSPLPAGGTAVAVDGETLLVGGTDRVVYAGQVGKKFKPLGDPLPGPIAALVPVADDRLAVVSGSQLVVLSRADGAVRQALDLPAVGTCIGADRTGRWLAVGTAGGAVAVFDGQDKADFDPADADKLHDGGVHAVLFEPDELRFFSAGADGKLFSTHARGRLEPEDKGRSNGHDDAVTALLAAGPDRFLSGGRDGVVKNWPRVGGVKPQSLANAGRVAALAAVTVYNVPALAVFRDDNSVLFVPLAADGRFPDDGEPLLRLYGAADWAKNEFSFTQDFKRREKALKEVADWQDAASVDLIAARVDQDPDHQLRLLAAKLLAGSAHPRAVGHLEAAVGHRDDKVRVEAFQGLRAKRGPADLGPLDLALKTGHPDVGVLAVDALAPLAGKDDQALARLTAALDHRAWDVRKAAVGGLEKAFAADPPAAGLTALGSTFGDARAEAVVRFYGRKLLADPRVLSAVRRRLEDDDPGVRRAAFLVSVLARWGLANFLRKADPELHRQLNDLQGADQPIDRVPAADKAKLTADDYDVPLQATAARALDTCLRGARALAVLGDPRAFGLLLQLSREDDPPARVDVCRALAALGDPRAVTRLRSLLYDPDASVRDAAYSALARIEADPLAAASSALTAAAEDVRRRGLQSLVEALRADPASERAVELLALALNDPAAGVRLEAWKAALGLKVGGGGEPTLRFALKSTRPDVRREVLTEVTAQPNEPWATPLLHEFFDDPDPGLRAEAFAQATRKPKDLGPLEAALGSRFADARRLAVDALAQKAGKPAQALLAKALHDPDRDNRQRALAALVDEDAVPPLRDAAGNEHPDVRVRAAAALAVHGDPAALKPLLDLATADEPAEKERVAGWLDSAEAAFNGLAELGDPAAVAPCQRALAGKHARLRTAAARALAFIPDPAAAPALTAALAHPDGPVRAWAAVGLAAAGDPSVLAQLLAAETAAAAGAGTVLSAAVALGAAGERMAANHLDHADDVVRRRAVLVHLLAELRDPAGDARRLLECLSAKAPRTRLLGAQGVELYADPPAFREFVAKAANDRGDDPAGKVSADVFDAVAAGLVGGSPGLRFRLAPLLDRLADKDGGWTQAWKVFAKRFAKELEAADRAAPPRTASVLSAADLRELAFGAYVGLVREQGTSAAPPPVVRVRQTALARVFAVARADPGYARAAVPVFAQALGDPNQPVRTQAFDHLLALGTDKTRVASEAIESGHTDLGVKGLELLAGSAGDGDAVLERVAVGRPDHLALEAAKLLSDRRGPVAAAGKGVDAAYEPLRRQAVQWLAAEYDASDEAKRLLRAAAGSRYRKVREDAAFALAGKKDPAGFDALVPLLRDADDAGRQQRIADALSAAGDPRAADVLLDRLDHDPAGTAAKPVLLTAAAGFRRPDTADRLFAAYDRDKDLRPAAFRAILTVSGFDQSVDDPEGDKPDRTWEARQHPRHPAVLARLLAKVTAVGPAGLLPALIPAVRWCRGSEVDEPLATLAGSPDAELRVDAVEAAGWRFKHRAGPADPLVRALKHKDPVTQFAAAEGLARGGRADGLNVLLSSIDYLDDVQMRWRAVLALGELGDVRALDPLLKLAGEDGHALQEPAAEAIGHLRRGADADKVGRLLLRLAKGPGGVARRALVGLRWFDSPDGWKLIRQRAADKADWQARRVCVEQLGHRDDPANRDLLLKALRTDRDHDVLEAAFKAARRLWGAAALDPHFALLRHPDADDIASDADRLGEDVLKAVCDRGDPLRILEAFPHCPPAVQGPLEQSLLGRAELPVPAAAKALDTDDPGTARLAAKLLARAGPADPAARTAASDGFVRWLARWATKRADLDRGRVGSVELAAVGDAVAALAWAAVRAGADPQPVADAVAGRPDDPPFRPLRAALVRCLTAVPPTPGVVSALAAVARGTDPDARTVAADVLSRHAPDRAAELVAVLASDRPSFGRLAKVPAAEAFVASAAGNPVYQPVALPRLIASGSVDALAAVASDRSTPEAARLGAVEALGAMAAEPAERALAAVGSADGDDEDVRKAAWRALRRSKRARQKAAARPA